jgi:hypothetical protein
MADENGAHDPKLTAKIVMPTGMAADRLVFEFCSHCDGEELAHDDVPATGCLDLHSCRSAHCRAFRCKMRVKRFTSPGDNESPSGRLARGHPLSRGLILNRSCAIYKQLDYQRNFHGGPGRNHCASRDDPGGRKSQKKQPLL